MHKSLKAGLAAFCALALSFGAANANEEEIENTSLNQAYAAVVNMLPEGAKLIHTPYPSAMEVVGGGQMRARMVEDEDVPGGEALQIRVRQSNKAEIWNVNAVAKVGGEIKKDEVISLVYWARSASPSAGSGPALVQLAKEPFTEILKVDQPIETEWRAYIGHARAERDYASEETHVTFHLGRKRQTIEIGPVFLFNLGADIDLATLPVSE